MGRSSSSRKNKRSKVRTPKKSRKYRSKKLRRHVSDDENDSKSSMSSSSYSSSSEDGKYRSSKRSRIRVKKRVVSRKKKSKNRSYSSDSSEDDRRVKRKRAMSKGKRDRENKDKTFSTKKKKRRRDDSVSSTRQSLSCSSCKSDSISSHEDKRDGRDAENVERASKRVRYRPTSPLFNEHSASVELWMNEKVSVENNNSRRLRSVITIVQRDEEDGEMMNQDEHKEELVYDLDDYPSCRSNESNDSIDREKKMMLENERRVSDDDVSNGDDGSNHYSGETGKANEVNEQTIEARSSGETNSGDLELILRQKALENLLKFRGVKQSCFSNTESAPVRISAEDVSNNTVCANSTTEDDPKMVTATKSRSARAIAEKGSQIDENLRPTKPKVAASIINEVAGGSDENVKVGISAAKPKLVRPALTSQFSTELLSTVNDVIHQTGDVTASSSIENREKNGIEVASPSSDKPKHEANEGSQFEQKTISVMRGGEMVQVNYKVYIPKKAPALARRQLKR